MFIDNSVLMGVDAIGKGTRRGGPEVREELMLGIKRDDGEGELLEDRSGWGGRWDGGDRGFDDRGREILNRDICEWDAVDNFLELKVDVHILRFNGWVLELWA